MEARGADEQKGRRKPALRAFSELVAGLDYPMVVVTAAGESGPAGCLVGFSTQCSVNPSRYLVCLSDKNRTQRVASGARALGVHFLDADAIALAKLFGTETTDEVDTFARCRWHEGPEGAPILDACGRWFIGRIIERRVLGDHVGYLLEPIAAVSGDGEVRGLGFQQVKGLEPGHQP